MNMKHLLQVHRDDEIIKVGQQNQTRTPQGMLLELLPDTEHSKQSIDMSITLPPGASDVFHRGMNDYALDLSMVLAYGLGDTDQSAIQKACDRATESYAKGVLNWPRGRLAKPDIFNPVKENRTFRDLTACSEHFIKHLRALMESSPPGNLPTYPHAFIALESDKPDSATLVLAYESDEQWWLGYCFVPLDEKLGLEVESIRMCDVTAEEVLKQYNPERRA